MFSYLLFGHLIGVGVLAAAIGLETITLARVFAARDLAALRSAFAGSEILAKLFPAASLLLVASGTALAVLERIDPRTPWLATSILLVIGATVVGNAVVARRCAALAAAAFSAPGERIGDGIALARRDPALHAGRAFGLLAAIALIALMSIKPGAPGCVGVVVAVVAASVIGGTRIERSVNARATAV